MRTFRALAFAAALSVSFLACEGDGPTAADDADPSNDGTAGGGTGPAYVTISGTIYANSDASGFTNPVPNAEVRTSLDTAMATTDTAGRFTLVTTTAVPSRCTEYTLIVTAFGYAPYQVTGNWGSKAEGKTISLFPQAPTQIARC